MLTCGPKVGKKWNAHDLHLRVTDVLADSSADLVNSLSNPE
jgi:hypothetical protein